MILVRNNISIEIVNATLNMNAFSAKSITDPGNPQFQGEVAKWKQVSENMKQTRKDVDQLISQEMKKEKEKEEVEKDNKIGGQN